MSDTDKQLNVLINLLKDEIRILQKIKSLEEEKFALLSNNPTTEGLNQINDQLEKIIQDHAHLDQDRETILKKLSNTWSLEIINLKSIIPFCPSGTQNILSKIHNILTQFTDEIKYLNSVNKAILSDRLKLIQYAFESIGQDKDLEIDYSNRDTRHKLQKSLVFDTVI